MVCPTCGENNLENTKYCKKCGYDFSKSGAGQPAQQTSAQQTQTQHPQQQGYAPQQGGYAPQRGYAPQQGDRMPPQGYRPQQGYPQQGFNNMPPRGFQPQPGYGMPNHMGAVQDSGKGFSIAALVCGILGIIFSFIGLISILGLIISILGVVFGAVGSDKSKSALGTTNGLATAGLVCGIIGAVFSLSGIVCWACILDEYF